MYEPVEADWGSSDRRPPSAVGLLLVGLLVGLGVGLYYAWVAEPVAYVAAIPARLSDTYREEYLVLISQSFAADGDWEKARRRLDLLDDDTMDQTVGDLLEASIRTGRPASVIQNLANLAQRLGASSPAVALFAGRSESVSTPLAPGAALPAIPPTWTPTPLAPNTPAPIVTPTAGPSPTAVPIYRLLRRERVCDAEVAAPRIEVEILDATLEPLPGAEVVVRWEGGSDHFFSGYQPEKGLGYADFTMSEGVAYSLFIAAGSGTVDELRVETCPDEEGGLPGGWRLTFQNSSVFGDSNP